MTPRTITKVESGLIYEDLFTSLSGWTNDGSWTNVANPAFISWGSLQDAPFTHGNGYDKDGVREPNPFIDDDGTYYMLYDGGNGATGWTSFIARSYDKGENWEKLGQMPPGYNNGTGGNYAANAMGYLTKFSGKYYYYRVTSGTYFPDPNIGLPNAPYGGDGWEATNILGPWTYRSSASLALAAGTWTATNNLPCSVVKSGGTYYMFAEGQGVGAPSWQIGYLTSSTPVGPWTQVNPSVLARNSDGRDPENAKVFYHPGISKWIMLANLIAPDGSVTDQNVMLISSSLTDWSGAVSRIIQRICPMDGTRAIGVVSSVNIPEGTFILPNGDVPIFYDSNPERYQFALDGVTPGGWHLGRKLEGSTLVLSTHSLKFESGTSGLPRSITRSITHTDFVAEFAVQFTNNTSGTNIYFLYRGSGGSGYRLTVRNTQQLLLQRVSGGVPTTIVSASSGISTSTTWISRLKIVVSGSSHKCYIDGELQITATDATYASGTTVGFGGLNASNAEIRQFWMYKSESVTFRGLVQNRIASFKSLLGMKLNSFPADVSGNASVVAKHYPVDAMSVNGFDFLPTERVFGGDVYDLPVVQSNLRDSVNASGAVSKKVLTFSVDAVAGSTVRKILND